MQVKTVIWKTRSRTRGHGKRGYGKRGHGKRGKKHVKCNSSTIISIELKVSFQCPFVLVVTVITRRNALKK